jgi:hypothetical protein
VTVLCVVDVPPTTVAGDNLTAAICGASTVRVAIFDTPRVAVIPTGVLAVTAVVVMVKVADVAPSGTVTVEGEAIAEISASHHHHRPAAGRRAI